MPETPRWPHLRDELQFTWVMGRQGPGGLEAANTGREGVLHHIDFTRTVGRSKLIDKKLKELIQRFNNRRLRNEGFEFPDLLVAAYEYGIAAFAESAGKTCGVF